MRKLFTFLLALAASVGASYAAPAVAVNGKLPGAFSVSASKKVCFSQGNLKYTKSTGKFEFMTNQYDMAETYNQNVGDDYANQGVISLVGWATSGISRTGVNAYQPYSTYHDDAYYGTTSTKSASETLGDYDWGKNMGDGWRTLTADEWGYLIGPGNGGPTPSDQRANYQSLRGLCKITVSGTEYPGMIILPDDLYDNLPTEGDIASKWAACAVVAGSLNYTLATFTEDEWTALQAAGAVFLPAAGYRNGTTVHFLGTGGYYWSSSASLSTNAFYLYFGPSKLKPYNSSQRCNGNSVRLVSDISQYTITPNVDPQNAGVYYSTFFDSSVKYELPAGVEAYVADLSGANLLLTKIANAGQTIPANVAVILKSTVTPFTLTVSDADAVTFTATNDLQGTDVSIATPDNCYVLAGEDGVGFYHYTASMLNPHKAYVIYSGSNQAPKRMPFVFNQATGVDQVPSDQVQSTKILENGVLYIIKNGVKYNAQGQVIK